MLGALVRCSAPVVAGTLALSACTTPVHHEAFEFRGRVANIADGPVPKGTITIRLEEQAITGIPPALIAETRIESRGDADTVSFTMNVPREEIDAAADPGFWIILERDGRLIASNPGRQRYDGTAEVVLKIQPIIY